VVLLLREGAFVLPKLFPGGFCPTTADLVGAFVPGGFCPGGGLMSDTRSTVLKIHALLQTTEICKLKWFIVFCRNFIGNRRKSHSKLLHNEACALSVKGRSSQ